MKLILGIICLAIAALQAKAEVSAFALDQEYQYDYNGRVATGIAEDVTQFTGFGTKGKLVLQNQGNYIYVKFNDIRVGRGNERYDGDLREEFEYSYSVPEGPTSEVSEHLEKPIRVTVENGLVKSFDAYPDDAEWSINIKRAVLSLFQTNFDNINRVRLGTSKYIRPEDEENIYRVMEEGIGGECETVYEFLHQPDPKNPYARVMNVTKHRLYDKCNNRPHYFHTNLQGYKCTECEKEGDLPLKSVSRVDYQITGDRYHFTVNRIHSTGLISFSPFTSYGQTVISGVNQTLELEDSRPIQKPITFPADFVTYKSLAYTFPYNRRNPEDVDLTKAHHYNRQYERGYENYREEAKRLLNEMKPETAAKNNLAEGENHHLPDNVLELIRVLTLFNYDDFLALANENLQHEYLLHTVLPHVGTNPSILFIKYIIENRDYATHWPKVISRVPFYVREPSEKLIEEFRKFLEVEKVRSVRDLYSATLLAYGTLVHKGCVHTFTNPHPGNSRTFVRPEVCSRYVKEIYQKFEEAPETYQRLLYLNTLINTKVPEIYHYLKNIIHGDYSHHVRHTAMWGLTELLPELREEVTALMNPVFHNYTEDYVTRIYAFGILLETEPRPSYIYDLVDSLRYEPSHQVASYMYSVFVTIANASDPCYEKIAQHIRHSLQFVEPIEYEGIQYSRSKIFSYYNEQYNYGRTTHIDWIGANDSVIPREVYIRQSINLLGYNFDVVEMGLTTQGTDKLTSKIFGPDGHYSPYEQRKSVLNLFHRARRDVKDVEREREEIREKLHIKNREDQPFQGEFYLSMYNQLVKFQYIEEKHLQHILNKGYFTVPDFTKGNGLSADLESILSLTDVLLEIPNDMGMPVTLDLKIPVVLRVLGDIKVKVEPGLYPEDRNSRKPTAVVLEPHVTVDFDYKVQGYVGVTSPLLNTYGYGIVTKGSVQFPINGRVEYDPIHKKLKANYIPSKETYDILYYKTQPYTFITNRAKFVPIEEQKENILPVHYNERPIERDYYYGHDYFGAGVQVSFKYDYYWNDYGSYRSFLKSFFKKSTNYDDYFYWADRYYAGTRGILDYSVLNPTFRPFEYKVTYQPSQSNPTTEFEYTVDFDYYAHSQNEEYSEDHPDVVIPRVNLEKETYGLYVDVVGKGNVERRWQLQYNVSYLYKDEDFTVRKNVLNYQRSPLPNYDSEEFKLCYRGGAKYPSFGKTYYAEMTDDVKVEYNANLNFGHDCDNDKQIVLKAVVERSEEQKEYYREHKEHLPYYQQCQEDLKTTGGKFGYSTACWRLRTHLARLDQVEIDVEYKGIPDYIKNYTYKVSSYLRHYFYDNLEVNHFVENPENRLRIEANFSYDRPVVDVRIYKPHENVYYNKVYVPALIPIYEQYSATDNAKDKYLKKLLGKTYAYCYVTDQYVKTFDNVTYNAPLSDCYHVVAQDCSEEERYSVLMKNVNQGSYSKAVKVYLGNHKIEVYPEGDQLVLHADGEVRNLDENEKYVGYDREETEKPVYYISKRWNKYFLFSKIYGVNIFFDGKNAKIMISRYYRGNQCGICGDYNLERHLEFVGPEKCQYYEPEAFVNSYAVPDGSCQPPEYRKECDIQHSPECIIKVNRHVYMGKGEGSRKVCFTTSPLNECRPGCKPTGLVRRKAGFHCLEAQDEFTRSLVRNSKTRELTELKNKSEDFTEEVQVPESCIPY